MRSRSCERCDASLPVAGRGPIPRFCSTRCRVAAHRAKRLPVELTERDRWVRWEPVQRKDRVTKMPVTLRGRPASSTNPTTWATHAEAKASKVGVGLGFVLGDGIGCIDLDHVLDSAGRLDPAAAAFVKSLPATYTEVSPSGNGLHLWFLMAEVPGTVRMVGGVSVETYSRGRYMTVTARSWPGAPLSLAEFIV